MVKREQILEFEPSPNPYNPEDYAKIERKLKLRIIADVRLTKQKQKLALIQGGLCTICNQFLNLEEEELEVDHILAKKDGGTDKLKNLAVVHKMCHLKKSSWERKWRAYENKR